MIAFRPIVRLSHPDFVPARAFVLPDIDAFVLRQDDALFLATAHATKRVPGSEGASLVAASPCAETIAWSTRETHGLRAFSAKLGSQPLVAGDDASIAPYALAVSRAGDFVVVGGYAWTRAHEEHARAARTYEFGAPYDYGEIRPEVPPEPPREPGRLAFWSLGKNEIHRVAAGFMKAITRVAVDSTGHAFAAWDESGTIEARSTSKGHALVWSEKWLARPRSVSSVALLSGGIGAFWIHGDGIERRDPVRRVGRVAQFDRWESGATALSLTSRIAAIGGRDGALRFFSTDTGALTGEMNLDVAVHALAFGDDGSRLAIVTDDGVIFGAVVAAEASPLSIVSVPTTIAPPEKKAAPPSPPKRAITPAPPSPIARAAPPSWILVSTNEYAAKALVEVCGADLPAIMALAIERLGSVRAESIELDAEGIAIWLRSDDSSADVEARVSREPYPLGDRHMFLPLTAVPVSERSAAARAHAMSTEGHHGATLLWNGTVESSRLVLHGASARIGGDASCNVRIDAVDDVACVVEHRGHHIYIEPLGAEKRVVFGGEWARKRRFYAPQSLVVMPAAGRAPSALVVFDSAREAVSFGPNPWFWEGDGAWRHFLLARAIGKGEPCGAIVVRSTSTETDARWWERAAPIVARHDADVAVSVVSGTAYVAMRGESAAIEALAQELAHAFGERASIAWKMAAPGESPAELDERTARDRGAS